MLNIDYARHFGSDVRLVVCQGFWAAIEDWSHRSEVEGGNKNQPVLVDSWKRHIGIGRREIPAHSVPEFQTDEAATGLTGRKLQNSDGTSDNIAVWCLLPVLLEKCCFVDADWWQEGDLVCKKPLPHIPKDSLLNNWRKKRRRNWISPVQLDNVYWNGVGDGRVRNRALSWCIQGWRMTYNKWVDLSANDSYYFTDVLI